MIDPLAGQTSYPMLYTQAGACSVCTEKGPVFVCVAVAPHNPVQLQPCETCLDLVRTGSLLPDTRRLLAIGADMHGMMQILLPGQRPDAVPASPPNGRVKDLARELADMVAADPQRGTEFETAFLDGTRYRTREIGAELYDIGGHPLMVAVYNVIRSGFGPSARSLEVAWSGVGEWFD